MDKKNIILLFVCSFVLSAFEVCAETNVVSLKFSVQFDGEPVSANYYVTSNYMPSHNKQGKKTRIQAKKSFKDGVAVDGVIQEEFVKGYDYNLVIVPTGNASYSGELRLDGKQIESLSQTNVVVFPVEKCPEFSAIVVDQDGNPLSSMWISLSFRQDDIGRSRSKRTDQHGKVKITSIPLNAEDFFVTGGNEFYDVLKKEVKMEIENRLVAVQKGSQKGSVP